MSVPCLPAAAQDADKPAADGDFAFWASKARSGPVAAAQVAVMGNHPLTALALRVAGRQFVVWDEVGFAELFAPELNPDFLRNVKDGRWMPIIAARQKDETPLEDWAFYRAYSEALVRSFDATLDAFKKSAEENKDVTIAHLMNTPSKFRGKVIPIKGTMVRLRREDASLLAQQNGGLKNVFVAWVVGPTRGSNPFVVQFPILPEGLEPAETMRQEVRFFGYFLATYKYEAATIDGKPTTVVTPVLVGPTLIVDKLAPAPVEAETPLPLIVLGAAVGFMMFLSVVFFVMYFWLERNDRSVQSKLAQIKAKHTPFLFANEAEPAADDQMGTIDHPASSQLVFDNPSPARLPEAKPIDPERN
jgi:hypothetical protein